MKESSSRHLRIVLNGKSASNQEIREAVGTYRDEGCDIDVRVTWEEGDAERLAVEAVEDEVDIVVAAGGDGTINEVLHGLMDATEDSSGPALAVIPLGTANDFAVGCGIPLKDIPAALRLAVTEEPSVIDVGTANDQYFINVATAGLGAEITAETPTPLKKLMGGSAYALMGLVRMPELSPYHVRINVGGLESEFDILMMTIGNGRNSGNGKVVAPDAKLDDRLIDVMTVHDAQPSEWLELLDEYAEMDQDNANYVRYQQVQSFRVEFEEEIQLNLDGEPYRNTAFDIGVEPHRLRMIFPQDCDLLLEQKSAEQVSPGKGDS
jgi:lipid kinase YegS